MSLPSVFLWRTAGTAGRLLGDEGAAPRVTVPDCNPEISAESSLTTLARQGMLMWLEGARTSNQPYMQAWCLAA